MRPALAAVLLALAACAPAAERRRAACLRDYAPEAALKDPWHSLLSAGGEPTSLFLVYSCRAITERSDAPCAALPDVELPDGKAFPQVCRQDAAEVAFSRSLIGREADAKARCLAATGDGEGLLRSGTAAALCDAVVSRLERPDEAARAARSFASSSAAAEELELGVRRLLGDASACERTSDPEERHNCRHFAAYRAGSCGDLLYCRLMAGAGPEACAAQAEKAKREWCAR